MAVDMNMNIMVVDDYKTMLRILRNLLRQLNFNNIDEATPFIMITAESKSENVIAAKEAGVSNYIVKPFNAETLKAKITSVFGNF